MLALTLFLHKFKDSTYLYFPVNCYKFNNVITLTFQLSC